MLAKAPPPTNRPLHTISGRRYTHSGFFVLRTPLLPLQEFQQWSAGLSACGALGAPDALAAALAGDRRVLRERLQAVVARPEVAEALFLASPSLEETIPIWLEKPAGEKGLRIERALVRYFARMACRPTPFGLFAGCSTGRIDRETVLEVAAREEYGRHSRLDMDFLSALTTAVESEAGIRPSLRFFPNSSLYEATGRLRYAECRVDGKGRNHHLVAVDFNEYLKLALDLAATGARPGEIAQALVAADPEIEPDEAAAFVDELIDSQILVAELAPPVTGAEPVLALLARLAPLPAAQPIVTRLEAAHQTLQDLDCRSLGNPPRRYRDFADQLEDLPARFELERLIQVDLVKPAPRASLGTRVLKEVMRGVEMLLRLSPRPGDTPLDRFRQDFLSRYEEREMPLLEVLDEEVGIGFMKSQAPAAEGSPLLAGLPFPALAGEDNLPGGGLRNYLLGKFGEALAAGRTEIRLEKKEIDQGTVPDAARLPDAFAAMVTLAAASPAAVDEGDFQVCFDGASGPSGTRLLGRFCHLSPDLTASVEGHLRQEEALQPEAVFAEIVHLPDGRIGNILFRPTLREYEIPFLGRSGAPREKQIPLTDLLVSVRGNRVRLRSQRLGREVIPRLTSAHNFGGRNLGVYKFLCSLQSQGTVTGVNWSWGALDGAPFLPRVTIGRLVLARAQWRLDRTEIEKLTKQEGDKGFARFQSWREDRGLPRLVELADFDNTLLIDLDNVVCVEVLLNLIKNRPGALLRELFPGPDLQVAAGPEGLFAHELVIPLVRLPAETKDKAAASSPGKAKTAPPAIRRTFAPGSEWLYAKLYCGTSNADRILREIVGPVVQQALKTGAADRWFFIRFSDPGWHIRLRLQGDPARLSGEVLPLLHRTAEPLLQDGRLQRLLVDTYEREIERYGGPAGMEPAEEIFQADSEAVLAIVANLAGDSGADARWRLTLGGIDQLLTDLGLDLPARLEMMEKLRLGFWEEFQGTKPLKKQLGLRFREERADLEKLLFSPAEWENPARPLLEALAQRRRRTAGAVSRLKEAAGGGTLTSAWPDIAASFVHMHANRLLRSAARAHELVIYDFLGRLYRSRLARKD